MPEESQRELQYMTEVFLDKNQTIHAPSTSMQRLQLQRGCSCNLSVPTSGLEILNTSATGQRGNQKREFCPKPAVTLEIIDLI